MKLYQRKEKDLAPQGQADPYMIKAEDGRYYLYTTGGHLFSSDSLMKGWSYEGICLDAPGQQNVWAPSVIKIEEQYYMYYSSMQAGDTSDHGQTLRVATADGPQGPFVYQKDILPPFSIDPHVVETPSGLYMFYCNNDEKSSRAGTYILCDRMLDPYNLEGKAVPAIVPTLDEEIFQRNRFKPGQHWHTVEGAFYFYDRGVHYLMYSGACYQNPSYFIGFSTACEPEDTDLRMLSWTKYPDNNTYAPLMCRNEFMEGVGHNSVIRDSGKLYVVYHGRDYQDFAPAKDTRVARIDELTVDAGRLSVTMTL